MKIVEYVAAFYETREPARAEVATIEQLLSVPWVAKHKVNRGFTRYSIANGDTFGHGTDRSERKALNQSRWAYLRRRPGTACRTTRVAGVKH